MKSESKLQHLFLGSSIAVAVAIFASAPVTLDSARAASIVGSHCDVQSADDGRNCSTLSGNGPGCGTFTQYNMTEEGEGSFTGSDSYCYPCATSPPKWDLSTDGCDS